MSKHGSYPPVYHDAFQRASENLRRTLPYINQHKTPINPVNYAVWYEYVSGGNQALNNEIDTRLSNNQPITTELTQHLYEKFVLMGVPERLEHTQEELRAVVDSTMSHISRAEETATGCVSGFSETQRLLENCDDIQQVKEILAVLLDNTRLLGNTSSELKQQLNDSTLEIQKLQKELEAVKEQAKNDALTGLINRGTFDIELSKLCQQSQTAFSLVLFDIDHFKQINDRFGHLLGDKVLQFFASLMKQHAENFHLAARFGGEEMAMIFFNLSAREAAEIADIIRIKLSETRLKRKDSEQSIGTVTVSAGISEYQPDDSMHYLIERADTALYESKEAGRNCITIR